MNMRKRKNAGRLLSRLLCLVTAMGMLVPMALAEGASVENSGIITEKKFLREI